MRRDDSHETRLLIHEKVNDDKKKLQTRSSTFEKKQTTIERIYITLRWDKKIDKDQYTIQIFATINYLIMYETIIFLILISSFSFEQTNYSLTHLNRSFNLNSKRLSQWFVNRHSIEVFNKLSTWHRIFNCHLIEIFSRLPMWHSRQ